MTWLGKSKGKLIFANLMAQNHVVSARQKTHIQLYYYAANQIPGAHAHKYDIVQWVSY